MNWIALPSGQLINVANLAYVSELAATGDGGGNEIAWIICYFTSSDEDNDLSLYGSDAVALHTHITEVLASRID